MKQSKKTYPIANQNLDVPEKTLLLYTLKSTKYTLGNFIRKLMIYNTKTAYLLRKANHWKGN